MRILLVDDQPGLANTFALSLRNSGYTTLPFTSPEEALEAIRPDDVLITDYHMPTMTGLEVAKIAYQRGWRGPLFIMSGNSQNIREPLQHPLLQAVLSEPLSAQELLDAIFPPPWEGDKTHL